MKWYVLQTKPCIEHIVLEHMRRANVEAFLPQIRVAVRGVTRQLQRLKPLFPSYLFVRISPNEINLFRMIKYTRGVRKFVSAGDIPLSLDDVVIDVIKGRVDEKGIIQQQLLFKAGDSVRICYGPLTDLVGVLEKPISADGRVKVLLNLVGKKVRLELPCVRVEKVA
ncbi:MAG: transcription termination/antitermination NusG family protein [Pseudomonadota bacterium]